MAGKASDKKLSRDLSNILDELGFDRSQRWERIHHENIQTELKDLSMKLCINTDNQRIFIGSLREGIGFCGLSDLDVLQVHHRVTCTERDTVKFNDNRLVLRIVESSTPPGYCLLECIDSSRLNNTFENLLPALVKQNNTTYLSSKLFIRKPDDDNLKVSEFMKVNTHYLTQNGPSTPKYVYTPLENRLYSLLGLTPNRQIDFVRAFPCDGHSALRAWQRRPRESNWPSRKIVNHIMNLPIYVVPVGQHGSINEDIQWRISFVEAETYLVKTLNNVQVKILVLLKLVIKHYMDQECKCITSYMVKNVVFWLAETIPQKKFRQKHLMARLEDSFKFLIQAVERRTLPCYMQPERNLFANKLNTTQKRQVLNKLKYVLVHGRFFVAANLFGNNSAHSACGDIIRNLMMFNLVSKLEICKLAMYPLQSQILFYLTPHKLNHEEEFFVYNIPVFLRFFWVYGIKGYKDWRTISIYKQLAKSDNFHRNRNNGHEMIQSKAEIMNTYSYQCMIVRIIACILRIITMFCVYGILDNLDHTIDSMISSNMEARYTYFERTFSLIFVWYVCVCLFW